MSREAEDARKAYLATLRDTGGTHTGEGLKAHTKAVEAARDAYLDTVDQGEDDTFYRGVRHGR